MIVGMVQLSRKGNYGGADDLKTRMNDFYDKYVLAWNNYISIPDKIYTVNFPQNLGKVWGNYPEWINFFFEDSVRADQQTISNVTVLTKQSLELEWNDLGISIRDLDKLMTFHFITVT